MTARAAIAAGCALAAGAALLSAAALAAALAFEAPLLSAYRSRELPKVAARTMVAIEARKQCDNPDPAAAYACFSSGGWRGMRSSYQRRADMRSLVESASLTLGDFDLSADQASAAFGDAYARAEPMDSSMGAGLGFELMAKARSAALASGDIGAAAALASAAASLLPQAAAVSAREVDRASAAERAAPLLLALAGEWTLLGSPAGSNAPFSTPLLALRQRMMAQYKATQDPSTELGQAMSWAASPEAGALFSLALAASDAPEAGAAK